MFLNLKQIIFDEDRLLKNIIGVSLGAHLIFFTIIYLDIDSMPPAPMEEWVIDADLSTDFGDAPAKATVIPNAEVADKAAVPSNLLPQINRSFEMNSRAREDEGFAEESTKIEKSKLKGKKSDGIAREKKNKSRLKMQEALRRLAMEKLRKEQKTKSRDYKTEKKGALARVKQNLADDQSKDGIGGVEEKQRYRVYLTKTIHRNYDLPSTYKINNKHAMVYLRMKINENGELVVSKIDKSSGDEVFDSYTLAALRKSAPFSAPPKSLVGKSIVVAFER